MATSSSYAPQPELALEAAVEVVAEVDDEEYVPTMGIDPTFLEKNSQSHAIPLTAFGDIFDNSKESGASRLHVTMRRSPRAGDTLVLTDDGRGLTEATMFNSLAMIGHSTKDLDHYGFGAKTALPRIAHYALVFSRCVDSPDVWSVLLLSTRHSARMHARELQVPICSWSTTSSPPRVLNETGDVVPLRASNRRDSLASLLGADGIPYTSEAELLSECRDAFDGQRFGTRIVMWSLAADLDLKPKKFDICVKGAGSSAPRHEASLRAYSEVLYLHVGERVVPSLQIFLFEQRVEYRDWEEYLLELPREMPLPQPDVHAIQAQHALVNGGSGKLSMREASHLGRDACATLTLGYARDMADLHEVLSSNTGQLLTEKRVVEAMETGLYVYHRGRLTRPLEKLPLNFMYPSLTKTSIFRITTLGHGLTGYIDENYLKPTHNKAAYFDTKLFSQVMDQANAQSMEYIRKITVPKYAAVRGCSVQDLLAFRGVCTGFGKQSSAKSNSLKHGHPKPPPPKLPKPKPKQGRAPKPPKPKPVVLEEDTRMRPVDRNDKQVGRVVKAENVAAGVDLSLGGRGRYFLRLEDGTLSTKAYRARCTPCPTA